MLNIAKRLIAWIVVLVALLVLLIVHFTTIKPLRDQRVQQNNLTNQRVQELPGLTARVRTKGDLANAEQEKVVLLKQEQDVLKTWGDASSGLDEGFMGDKIAYAENENETPVEQRWEIFQEFMIRRYTALFEKTEESLLDLMTDTIKQDLIYTEYGKDITLTSLEQAEEKVEEELDDLLHESAHIFSGADLIKVTEEDKFREEEKETGWDVWRQFLIHKHIMTNIIPQSVGEVMRTVAIMPRQQEENGAEPVESEEKVDVTAKEFFPQTETYKTKRFIEQIEDIQITSLEIGGRVLPKPGVEESEEIDPFAPPPEITDTSSQPEGTVANNNPYDIYTVSVTLVGHITALQAFDKAMLASDNFLCTGSEMFLEQVDSGATTVVHTGRDALSSIRSNKSGRPQQREVKRPIRASQMHTGNQPQMSEEMLPVETVGYDLYRPATPFVAESRFDREPPLRGTFTYQFYRFRFEGDNNPVLPVIETAKDPYGYMPY